MDRLRQLHVTYVSLCLSFLICQLGVTVVLRGLSRVVKQLVEVQCLERRRGDCASGRGSYFTRAVG